MTLTRADVLAAAERVRGHVRRTPLVDVGATPEVPGRLLVKCELLQVTGSFKARGAFNRQLAAQERGELDPGVGVVAASGGNAGLAHAYAARALGVPATVFVPETAPAVKVARLREYAADVRLVGDRFAQAQEAAVEHAERSGALFCHAYDHVDIAAGAGTLAEELLADEPGVDTVVVAVGGGGLFAGVGVAVEGRARVVTVEPVTIPTLHAALAAGRAVDVEVSGVAADSLGATRVGRVGLDVALRTGPLPVLVDDDAIVAARRALWRDLRLASELGAATAYAAVLAGAYRPAPDETVAVVVCGANTDPATLEGTPGG